MVNFPNIENIEKEIVRLLKKFSTTHEDFEEDKKTHKPEYTKKLRQTYNKINNEIDKLRLYNNEVEKLNRDERNKKKGVENKPKQKVGRKKVLKGGDNNDNNDNNLTTNQNNLTQNEIQTTSNKDEFKPLPKPEIFKKYENNNNEIQNNLNINETLASVFDTEVKPKNKAKGQNKNFKILNRNDL